MHTSAATWFGYGARTSRRGKSLGIPVTSGIAIDRQSRLAAQVRGSDTTAGRTRAHHVTGRRRLHHRPAEKGIRFAGMANGEAPGRQQAIKAELPCKSIMDGLPLDLLVLANFALRVEIRQHVLGDADALLHQPGLVLRVLRPDGVVGVPAGKNVGEHVDSFCIEFLSIFGTRTTAKFDHPGRAINPSFIPLVVSRRNARSRHEPPEHPMPNPDAERQRTYRQPAEPPVAPVEHVLDVAAPPPCALTFWGCVRPGILGR
jgi:hypothetical protein